MTLLEVPIGFTLAMSCVLANRVILNAREAGTTVSTLNVSKKRSTARGDNGLGDMSFGIPGTLSQFEMGQLRSIRASHRLEDILETDGV